MIAALLGSTETPPLYVRSVISPWSPISTATTPDLTAFTAASTVLSHGLEDSVATKAASILSYIFFSCCEPPRDLDEKILKTTTQIDRPQQTFRSPRTVGLQAIGKTYEKASLIQSEWENRQDSTLKKYCPLKINLLTNHKYLLPPYKTFTCYTTDKMCYVKFLHTSNCLPIVIL